MIKASDYLKQRSEDNKLLKKFKEITKEESKIIKDLSVAPLGVKLISENGGFKFIYPTSKEFYASLIQGNISKYEKILKPKTIDQIKKLLLEGTNKELPIKIQKIYDENFNKGIKLEDNLNDFIYESNNYKREKGQTNTFIVEEIIEGKIDNLGYLRAPLIFKEATFKRDINKREVRISYTQGNKIIPNIHLLYELSAIRKKPIENFFSELSFDKDNYKKSIDKILTYLNVEYEWDLNSLEFVNTTKNTNNLETNFRIALNLFVNLEKYRFLNIIVNDEISLSSNYTLTNFNDESAKKIIYLNLPVNVIQQMLDKKNKKNLNEEYYEEEVEEYNEEEDEEYNEINKKIKSLYDISDISFNEKWIDEYEQVNLEFLKYHNVSNLDELKNSKKAIKFANQIIFSRPISWNVYLEFIENDIDFIEIIKQDISLNNTVKIKKCKFLFKTEKLQNKKLTEDIKTVIDKGIIENVELIRNNIITDKEILKESEIKWTFNSDYTQRKAVRNAISSKYHIIQGPPGTGKTQTILNIISELSRRGKKILVVSEKKTAVEVIAKKLKLGKINLFSTYLELYKDNEILENIKSLSKIIHALNKKPILKGMKFQSNLSILNKIKKFLEITNSLQKKDLINIEILINNEIVYEDFKNIKLFEKLNVLTKSKYEEIIKTNKTFDLIDNFLSSNNFNSNEIEIIKKSKADVIKIFLLKYCKNATKPWWWTKSKLQHKAKNDLFVKNISNKLLNEYNIKKLFYDFTNIEYKKILEYKEPKWEIFNLVSENEKIVEKIKNISELMKNIFSFEYENFNNEKIFDENKKEITLIQSNINEKMLNNNIRLKRVLEELQNRKMITKFVRNFILNNWNDLFKLFNIFIGTIETVSEYIPLNPEIFDYVIIDEASQIFVERALPSIYRGKRIVISGDKEQLRPYSTKKKITNEFLDSKGVDYSTWIEHESLLDLFSELIGKDNQSILKIHYRSNSYELIKYSNDNFYNSKLSFIPIPSKLFMNPIKLIRVEQDWKNQISYNEINKIIEILNQLVNQGQTSIGIISMSNKQTLTLRKKIMSKANQKVIELVTTFDKEGIFIKSLNDVQGDERDIIIFSIGYDGKAARYAYINQNYGGNRLNVAASRARKQMIVVMNGNPEEMTGRELKNPGVDAFLNFIEFVNSNSFFVEKKIGSQELIDSLKKNNIKDYKILSDDKFEFASYEFNKAFFIVKKEMIINVKSYFWKYVDLLKIRGYKIFYDFSLENKIKQFEESGIFEKPKLLEESISSQNFEAIW